ncbi:hypothetical protein SCLCIDRAFT_1208518 [Scleroderma citrinum Foug A]|uniref:Uncharacterized protein n=1 Tax=Scleroderma citrinum Foug A TaxID=1036808 RepID=A0A0C3AVZ3_9AGAM|nr:hypothetical protein SCLCIDRAFT_1208518 [Scleroderma citrinum Foug A]
MNTERSSPRGPHTNRSMNSSFVHYGDRSRSVLLSSRRKDPGYTVMASVHPRPEMARTSLHFADVFPLEHERVPAWVISQVKWQESDI